MAKYIRKVQFTGKSTFTVSLPKKWATDHGISPGSQVVIEDVGPYIVIKPFKPGEIKKERVAIIQVRSGDSAEAVARRIIGAYVMGFSRTFVRSEAPITPLLRNAIRETILNKLPGAEIVAENGSEIEIQVLLNSNKVSLLNTVKRLAKVVHSILRDACSAVVSGDDNLMREIAKEDDSVDRVFLYTIRLINQIARGDVEEFLDPVELIAYRVVAKLLERIGDHAANIALNAVELVRHRDLLSVTGDLCSESLGIFNDSIEAFFAGNPYAVDNVASKVLELRKLEEQFLGSVLDKLEPRKLVALRMMLESIRRVAEYSKDIGELALDIGINKVLVSQYPQNEGMGQPEMTAQSKR